MTFFISRHLDIWCIRIFVQNGMMLYASLSFIYLLLTLNIVLMKDFGLDFNGSLSIILVILLTKVVFYHLIENFVSYRYCKFLFAPWLTYVTFLIAIFMQNLHSVSSFNFFFQIFLTIFSFFLFAVKIFLFISREFWQYRQWSNSYY